ncbi:MAG: class I SAM-dependent methyltransferase [Solirubrobacteraceae bacterium]
MRDYYEDLWGRLPEDLDPPDLNLRLAHLRAGVRAGDRVLDLGCGDGRFAQEIARMGAKPIGVEVAQAAIDRARAGHPDLDFRLAPIDGPLPLDDVSFDVVWTSEVIEHVADTARWLSEVRRVLVPRGRLLLTTPSHGRLRVAVGGIEAFSDPLGDHLHLYTRASLKALLAEFGFDEISVRTAGGPPFLRRLLLARAVR